MKELILFVLIFLAVNLYAQKLHEGNSESFIVLQEHKGGNTSEESVYTFGNGLLNNKNYPYENVQGYRVLRNDCSFKSQVTDPNTVYEIRYDFNLKDKDEDGIVEMPQGCVLKFVGGRIHNGCIVHCGRIENSSNSVIFSDVSFYKPDAQFVRLAWFDYSSDADALENAAKFGHVDGTGEWLIDKTVTINNDFQLVNGDFSCKYGIKNIVISSPYKQSLSYQKKITEGATEIPLKLPFIDAEGVAIASEDIYYKTDRNTRRNGTRGEIMLIKEILPDKVVFNSNVGTLCEYLTNTNLVFFRLIKVSIQSCSFHSEYRDETDKGGILVSIGYAKAKVSNCCFEGCSVGLALGGCVNSIVSSCIFEKVFPWAVAFSDGTCNSTVIGCTFDTNRHAWTNLGEKSIVKFCQISNNVCCNSLLAICPHANSYGITISNNMVKDSKGGVGSYAPNTIIKDNTITNIGGFPAIYLTEAGGVNPVIQGNIIENCKGSGGAIRNDALDLTSDECWVPLRYCEVKDNVIRNCPDFSGIKCDYSKVDVVVPVTIANNTLRDIGYTAISVTSNLVMVTGNQVHRISRLKYAPISIICPDKTPKHKYAFVEGNLVTFCSGNNIDIKDFETVYFNSNESFPNKLKVKFDNCNKINRGLDIIND